MKANIQRIGRHDLPGSHPLLKAFCVLLLVWSSTVFAGEEPAEESEPSLEQEQVAVGLNGKVLGTIDKGVALDAQGNEVIKAKPIEQVERQSEQVQTEPRVETAARTGIETVDFIAGGTSEDGITPVKKIRVE